jgi:TatD DNase family protein
LAKKYHLPLFLHTRGAAREDFARILREEGFGEDGGKAVGGNGGVVHSFTGPVEELTELVRRDTYDEFFNFTYRRSQMDMGFYIR